MHVEISRSISSNSPAQLEIKDAINECLRLLVEVFMKVMNGLVMTLKEDEIFMCLAILLCEQFCRFPNKGAKISIKSYFMRSFFSILEYSAEVKC